MYYILHGYYYVPTQGEKYMMYICTYLCYSKSKNSVISNIYITVLFFGIVLLYFNMYVLNIYLFKMGGRYTHIYRKCK